MKNIQRISWLIAILSLTACTSVISEGVEDDGTVSGKVIFPDVADATLANGIFPTIENITKIAPGMSRDDLFYLIGHPHFREINGAREWDYIFKFRQMDNTVNVCQYKVIFDNADLAQSFFWKPEACQQPNATKQTLNLSTDVLFVFNRGGLGDITSEGKVPLDAFADKIIKNGNNTRIAISGYTDYLGSEAYNLQLSQLRAASIGQYLVNRGVTAKNILTNGFGEANPVVVCNNKSKRQALVKCLAPNRRVSIETW